MNVKIQDVIKKRVSKMIKISVIIPVYNVEQYLPKCLDSVLNQTLKDIEIICINDESPDNCAQILEEYQKRDSRIIILNQKNSGQGSARNRGLEIAKGKYIQFLDSDDFYEPTCCEEMYNLMEQHKDIDVACFDCNIIYDAYEEHQKYDNDYFRMKYMGKKRNIPAMAHQLVDVNCWNKIFRKSFLDKYKIYFPEKLHYEDVGFFWFWITKVSYIYFYQKKLTNYLRRKGSFLGEIYEKKSKTIFDAFAVNELIYKDLCKSNKWNEYKTAFIRSYLMKIRWLIECFPIDARKEKRRLINLCASFLSQFDLLDFQLSEEEFNLYNNVINKNYYIFGAYTKYDVKNILPMFEDGINIVFCTDKNYISYLSVTLQSIIENSSPINNYDIVIVHDGIYDFQKRYILSQRQSNISIRFFNIQDYIVEFNLNNLFTRSDMSIAAYYRLFLGKIFFNYKKILYLDCDLIVTTDIADLFAVDINNYTLAACLDTHIANNMVAIDSDIPRLANFKKYMEQTFNYTNSERYFNSGVLLINIDMFNSLSVDHLLHLANINKSYYYDQNVLNAAFSHEFLELSPKWNVQTHIKYYPKYRLQLPVDVIQIYDDYDEMPYILHYTSQPKVWADLYKQWNNVWWQYARKSPYYEILMQSLCKTSHKSIVTNTQVAGMSIVRNVANYSKNRFDYYRCKLLSKITLGKLRKHYKKKRKELKSKLKQVRKFLKGK